MLPNTSIETRQATCAEHGGYESRAIRLLGTLMRWSGCPECSRIEAEAEAEKRRIEEERARQVRIEASLKRAGIPARFRGRSLTNFVAESPAQQTALAAACDFAERFEAHLQAGTSMVFSGKPGTGKSHLATAIAQAVMAAGYTAMYLNALDAIRMVRQTWRRDAERSEEQVMAALTGLDLLVLDEIGMQYGTEGEQVVLFDIINRRYQDEMPMLLLTNQGKAGLRDYLGERAFDRLRESGRWIAFDWESRRGAR